MTPGSGLHQATTSELLGTYRSILAELRRRGVIRTGNAPTGDFAETLVKVALKGELAANSEKSWDVRTPAGERIQVKSRLLVDPAKSKQRQLSPIRSWGFDSLVVVLFDADYRVWRGVKLPIELVRGSGTQSDWVNGELIVARDSLLDHPDAEDLTELLRAAADSL
ncbi:MAG TPA: hypothetical protein VEU29_00120 [Actinomycetota bacterium]|nr:hypothetical protein [Actinomycetota bacterium]